MKVLLQLMLKRVGSGTSNCYSLFYIKIKAKLVPFYKVLTGVDFVVNDLSANIVSNSIATYLWNFVNMK